MKSITRSLARQALLLIALLALMTVRPHAATIPEPDSIIYGQVLNFDHGYQIPVTDGTLQWTFRLDGANAKSYVLKASLSYHTNNGICYVLKVPHEALVSGLWLADVSSNAIPMSNTDTRYHSAGIMVNGEFASILAPGADSIAVSSDRRLSAYRVDLQLSVAMPDSDGNGLADWWEQKYFGHLGVAPGADADGDGWSNLQEYLRGADPTVANAAPTLVLDNVQVDEGTTELLSLQGLDANTPATQLVYTITQEPAGGSLRTLFSASTRGTNGLFGDKPLHAGDTFTQSQVDAGQVVVAHDNPASTQITFGLSLSDGVANHPSYQTNVTLLVHKPTLTDGTDATIWLDSSYSASVSPATTLTNWLDRAGAKTWLAGTNAPFDAVAVGTAPAIVNQGPNSQPVIALNVAPSPAPQYFALPSPNRAVVFPAGELTVFAVMNPQGNTPERQQLVNGANFQLAMSGANDNGRDSQVRFAAQGTGVAYSNHKIRNRWALVTAWQGDGALNLAVNGTQVGGPITLNEPTEFGSDPTIGAKNSAGSISEPFQGALGEVLVFQRNLDDDERQRINYALMSKWFGYLILDGSDEERDLSWRVASSGLTAQQYRTNFIPLYGPDHNYILIGGGGTDTLQGGMNDDILVGGSKADIMTGGGGSDSFVFNFARIAHGPDTITDFSPDADKDAIDISDLLRGSSTDLRDYVMIRTDGHNSYLDLDFYGAGTFTNHEIVLQNVVLRDEDRFHLWSQGNLITGNKRFPLNVTLSVVKATATEITSEPALINVHFSSSDVPTNIEVPFVLAGSAIRGTNFNLSFQRYDPTGAAYTWQTLSNQELFVQLKPGDQDFLVRVEPLLNSKSDPTLSVQMNLTAVPEWYDLSNSVATVQIVDGLQKVGVTAPVNQASETGTPGQFLLTRQGSLDVPLDVTVAMAGPAINGVDYDYIPTVVHFHAGQSNTVVYLTPILDENADPAQAAEMVLQSGAGYFIDTANQAATVNIAPSLPVITVEAYSPVAVAQDGTPGAFLFRRQGVSSQAVTVLFSVTGSAIAGRDYQRFNKWVTFAPGISVMLVPIAPVASATFPAGPKTIAATIIPDASFAIGASSTSEVRIIPSTVDFAGWRATQFPGSTNDLNLFALQDFNSNGVPNILEYAFGMNPQASVTDRSALPHGVITNNHFGVVFNQPLNPIDLDYQIMVSTNLVHWLPGDSVVQIGSTLTTNGNAIVTFIDTNPITGSPQRFLRVNVIRY